MFDSLRAELTRNHFNFNDVAKATGLSSKTVSNKMTGSTEFTRREMFEIKNKLFPELEIDYLFAETEEE